MIDLTQILSRDQLQGLQDARDLHNADLEDGETNLTTEQFAVLKIQAMCDGYELSRVNRRKAEATSIYDAADSAGKAAIESALGLPATPTIDNVDVTPQ